MFYIGQSVREKVEENTYFSTLCIGGYLFLIERHVKGHFLLVAFLIGFLGAGSIVFGPWFYYRGFLFLGSALLLVGAVLWGGKRLAEIVSLLLGVAVAFAVGNSHHAYWQTSEQAPWLQEEIVEVVSFPEMKGWYQAVELRRSCTDRVCSRHILWQAPQEVFLTAGEKFNFSCQTQQVENFSPDFDYQQYLAKEGIGFICQEGQMHARLEPSWRGIWWRFLEKSRSVTEDLLKKALPEPALGLAKGLVLGGSGFLDQETQEHFRRIGMTHIVAVSGYNILLVASFCFFLFGQLGFWRRQKLLLASGVVWLFILFVGAPASAVRAGSMALLFFLALATGRRSAGFMVLLVSAVLMLAYNPKLLFYDVGFQLSFMALIGILFASSWHQVDEWHWSHYWKEGVRTTLWVEAFILPLIMYHFSTLTWFSVVANVILLPLVPIAMLGTFLLLPFGFLPTSLLLILALPVYGVLTFLIWFAEFFAAFGWVAVEGASLSFTMLVGWYSMLVTGSVLQLRRRRKKWYAKAFVVDH